MDLVAFIIAEVKISVDDVPCMRALSEMYDCPYEFITSIDGAVRYDKKKIPEDLRELGKAEGESKFNYFQRTYPTLYRLLVRDYNLWPNYHGEETYFVRQTIVDIHMREFMPRLRDSAE